jgi:DUF4097 and DUF4098 domain-containing protein YvlB
MRPLTRRALTLVYAWSAVALGSTSQGDVSKVNGSVRLESGEVARDVSTVNGSVTVGASARAEEVETVNGSIRIDDQASVLSAETVNGGVTVGQGAQVRSNLETVNGSVTLRAGARVGGSVSNVNGAMRLEGATVEQGLETVNGDIYLASGTRVTGGIRIRDASNHSWFHWGKEKRNPRLTVEQGVVVAGPLRFEREVDLYVAPGVELPAIQGVEPQRHTLQ